MMRRSFHAAVLALSIAAVAGLATGPAYAMDDLRIIAPAKPGGGWDQTARSLAEVMAAGGAKGVTVENVPGAGGTVGLAQLIDQEKGKPNVMMVNGLVMIGAILTNQSPVNLTMTTPIARLTGEYEVIVVPAASEIKTLADLAAKIKADAGSVAIGGGSAGIAPIGRGSTGGASHRASVEIGVATPSMCSQLVAPPESRGSVRFTTRALAIRMGVVAASCAAPSRISAWRCFLRNAAPREKLCAPLVAVTC
jgi:tripartite-type tricarboxylate transporter receptor subunit TctC